MALRRSASWDGDLDEYVYIDDADAAPSGKKLRRLPIDRAHRRMSTRFESSSRVNRVGDAVVEGVSKGMKVKVNRIFDGATRFPKIEDCAHFHYDEVALGKNFKATVLNGQFVESERDEGSDCCMFTVRVSAKEQNWAVYRTYEDFQGLDRQIHRCIFDRRFSRLPQILDEGKDSQRMHGYVEENMERFRRYLDRLCPLASSRVNCGPILNWFEIDSKGHHLQLTSKSGINVPAIAAGRVIQQYVAHEEDELTLQVNDIVSIIDMPPEDESTWWRGKAGFQVGFFPRNCVEVIGDKTSRENAMGSLRRIKQNRNSAKPVLEKRGKMLSLLRNVMKMRPSKEDLQRSGIVKSRVFGADLGEHLENSCRSVPLVVERCTQMIEKHGVVEGVYRLPGISSNINRLRQSFDAHEQPDMESEQYLADIQCVASLCKMYFRELPNPLFTYQLYDTFEAACRIEEDGEKRMEAIAAVLGQLPPPHLSTTEFLMKHLARLASHSSKTKMTAKNLSIVWAPNLMKPQTASNNAIGMIDIAAPSVVVQSLINNVDWYFGERGLAAMSSSASIQIPPLTRSAQSLVSGSPTFPRSSVAKRTPPGQRRSKTTDDIAPVKHHRKAQGNTWRSFLSFGRKSVRSSYDITKGRPVISGPVGFVGPPPAAVLDAKDLVDAGPTNASSCKSATMPPAIGRQASIVDEVDGGRQKRQTSPVVSAFSEAFTRGSMALEIGSTGVATDGTSGTYRSLDEDDPFRVTSPVSPTVTSIDSPEFAGRSRSMYEFDPDSPTRQRFIPGTQNVAPKRVHTTDIDSYMASMLEATRPVAPKPSRLSRSISDSTVPSDVVEYTAL